METYIIKIIRRREEVEEPVLAGIAEDAGSGRTEQFSDAEGLLRLLEMQGKRRSDGERQGNRWAFLHVSGLVSQCLIS